jgi:hypothetical protein
VRLFELFYYHHESEMSKSNKYKILPFDNIPEISYFKVIHSKQKVYIYKHEGFPYPFLFLGFINLCIDILLN